MLRTVETVAEELPATNAAKHLVMEVEMLVRSLVGVQMTPSSGSVWMWGFLNPKQLANLTHSDLGKTSVG